MEEPKICLLVPCYNEALTIGKVVADFRAQLPGVPIYVYDNNSTDQTAEVARAAGAIVRTERKQGKGCAVRSMFRDIEADLYIMVDGDDTYPAAAVGQLLEIAREQQADMVIGDRLSNGSYYQENSRSLHNAGNNLVRNFINRFFGVKLHDIMSGYRVFSRRFVKSFPTLSNGFALETEMTIFALNNNLTIAEQPIDFSERPEGSFSKLNTFSDGMRVVMCIFNMYRHYRPLRFFSIVGSLFVLAGLCVGIPVIVEFVRTAWVSLVPSAILASGLVVVGVLFYVCGLVLDTIARGERCRTEFEIKTLTKNR